jgi:hypothetical protein
MVLNVRSYDFEDEGKRIKGMSMTYITGDVEAVPTRRGVTPMTVSIAQDLYDLMQVVPGVWDIQFSQRPGRGGKPTLTATKAKFRSPLPWLSDEEQSAA